jgi:hypothetical protein
MAVRSCKPCYVCNKTHVRRIFGSFRPLAKHEYGLCHFRPLKTDLLMQAGRCHLAIGLGHSILAKNKNTNLSDSAKNQKRGDHIPVLAVAVDGHDNDIYIR